MFIGANEPTHAKGNDMSGWDEFWNIIWLFFWGFAFVAYLMALFSVIGDLFRDRELNGWWKALWIICLIFIPFLTVLIYLIARGRGMAERTARSAKAASDATDSYIRDVAGTSPSDEIAKAQSLLTAGTISQSEFEQIKKHALSR